MDRETARRIWKSHISQSPDEWCPITIYDGMVSDGLRRVIAAFILGYENIEVRDYK